jgi:solute carrier family 25 (mitochondrial adenine nucleotide translocator), member 4/5/6/31
LKSVNKITGITTQKQNQYSWNQGNQFATAFLGIRAVFDSMSSAQDLTTNNFANHAIQSFPLLGLRMLIAPASRIQNLLTTQHEIIRQGRMQTPYHGMWDCMQKTRQREGILSLWRGNTISIPRFVAGEGMNFVLNDQIKPLLQQQFAEEHNLGITFAVSMLSGALAGAGSMFIIYPFDLAYLHRTTDILSPQNGYKRQFRGVFDIWRRVVVQEGPVGLYTGFTFALAGAVMFRTIYFGVHDVVKSEFGHNHDMSTEFALAFLVTMTAQGFSYPLELVQKRCMLTTGGGLAYQSVWHGIKEIWNKEGAPGFYRGFLFSFGRIVLASALLTGYDSIKSS